MGYTRNSALKHWRRVGLRAGARLAMPAAAQDMCHTQIESSLTVVDHVPVGAGVHHRGASLRPCDSNTRIPRQTLVVTKSIKARGSGGSCGAEWPEICPFPVLGFWVKTP